MSINKYEGMFRDLNINNYAQTYEIIPNLVNSIRKDSEKLSQEKRNDILGWLAEESALTLLKIYQTQNECYIHSNLIFEYAPNQTTEVDLMLITKNVLFVIECKHRSTDITLMADGSFQTGMRVESPINQNLGHIKKVLNTFEYGNIIPDYRVFNIVYLMFHNARMHNPITLFKKNGFEGGFAGYENLLALINKIENDKQGGQLPIKTLYEDFADKSKKFRGEAGKKQHIKNLKRRFSE